MADDKPDSIFTLEDLLTGLRADAGDIKDDALIRIQKRIKDAREQLASHYRANFDAKIAEELIKKLDDVLPVPELRNYVPVNALKTKEGQIHGRVEEILENPILQQEDPLRPAETAEKKQEYEAKSIDVITKAAKLALGMDFVGLVNLSNSARSLHSALKEPARQNMFIDVKTGVRTKEYLMGDYFFRELKDHIANPGKHISFVNIDLNYLDQINGIVGKPQADIALKLIAEYLKRLPEGLVVRNTAAADEFYVCFRNDAEGAAAIMEEIFVKPMKETFTSDLEKMCNKELAEGYNNRINDYTCAIGITSTRIPDGSNIYQRARALLNGGAGKEVIKKELKRLESLPAEEIKQAFHSEITDVRRAILKVFIQLFEIESERAMKFAKMSEKDAARREKRAVHSNIFIYDPKFSPDRYEYNTQVYRKPEMPK